MENEILDVHKKTAQSSFNAIANRESKGVKTVGEMYELMKVMSDLEGIKLSESPALKQEIEELKKERDELKEQLKGKNG